MPFLNTAESSKNSDPCGQGKKKGGLLRQQEFAWLLTEFVCLNQSQEFVQIPLGKPDGPRRPVQEQVLSKSLELTGRTIDSKHLLHIEGHRGLVVGNGLRLEVLHRAQPDREVKDMSTGDHIRAQIGKVRVFLGEDLTDKLLKGLPGYLLLEKG